VLGFQTIASLSSSFLTYESNRLFARIISVIDNDLPLDKLAAGGAI
jgi:hypothetical protein